MMVRSIGWGVFLVLALVLWWSTLKVALHLGLHDDRYVMVVAGPVICAFLFYWERARIFSRVAWDPAAGLPMMALALLAFVVARRSIHGNEGTHLSLGMITLVLASMAAFLLCYGRHSFRAAFFPLCCLVLAIPAPGWIMDRVIAGLQQLSAAISYEMIRLSGVPVVAQGPKLGLPGLEIEVAPECSGIRSCLSIALITLLAARLGLRSGWSRVTLVLSSIPLAVLKNAVRISVLAILSAYIDHSILQSPAHRYGGMIFTPLEVAVLAAFLLRLRTLEATRTGPKTAGAGVVKLQPSV